MRDRLILEQIDLEDLRPGGIETCISDILKYASDTDFIVAGVTSNSDRPLGRALFVDIDGQSTEFIPVARLKPDRSRKLVPNSIKLAIGAFKYRKLLRQAAPVVQAHRIEFGLVARVVLRMPTVQFIHTDSMAQTSTQSESMWRFMPWLYRLLERSLLPGVIETVIFNRPDGERLAAQYPRIRIMRTWFNPARFDVSADDAQAPRASYTDSHLLWVGRLEEQKNPQLAIEIADVLRSRGWAGRLTFVGDGSQRAGLESLVGKRDLAAHVTFLGAVPRSRVAQLMRTTDLLLMTSHYEGSPRVLIEANAVGLSVVAPPGADPDQALRLGENGVRTTSYDAEELADAVRRALSISRGTCIAAVTHLRADAVVPTLFAQDSGSND